MTELYFSMPKFVYIPHHIESPTEVKKCSGIKYLPAGCVLNNLIQYYTTL